MELVVTLAVAAVLLTMAVPSFSRMIASHRIRRAADELQMALITARSEAVKRNGDVRVVATGSGTGAWNSGWTVELADDSVVSRYDPLTNISIGEANTLSTLTYRPDGRLSGATAPKFTISATGAVATATKCLYVGLSGMPYYAQASNDGTCP